ncbi:MAG: M20/M25/M40 family metallo-hydrolase [Anaerolineae bacterium]|nr:M20/M25/M40 family metallo-hydrolase [Gemmatimonadaceae bacterium]
MTDLSQPLDVVEVAAALMRIDSTSGREGDVIAFTHEFLEQRGWTVRRIHVSDGRDNILATFSDAPAATLSTHLDTVPPFLPPRVEGDKLWGRGACDAKGIAAAMICAADLLRGAGYPVALLFVVGEETSHDGAIAANSFPARSRVLINGEPTESTLAAGTKGALRVTLETAGVAAHSAYPQFGRSAIAELVELLHELRTLEFPTDPTLGDTTVNIGMISGGIADNVLAPAAQARIMLRLVSPADEMLAMLCRWAGDRASVTGGVSMPAARLRTLAGFPTSVVAFATDIPALTSWGTPYLFGPGSIRFAHRDDEHVAISELRSAVSAYERLAVLALQAAAESDA